MVNYELLIIYMLAIFFIVKLLEIALPKGGKTIRIIAAIGVLVMVAFIYTGYKSSMLERDLKNLRQDIYELRQKLNQ